jgi:hypothetical protein
MSRGGQAGRSTIPGLQYLCETAGGPFTPPHFDHGSNNRSDHVFQKPVGVGLDKDLVIMADKIESLQVTDGIVVAREASFERGKVM